MNIVCVRIAAIVLMSVVACNRGAARVPGAAGTFHHTDSGFRSQHRDHRVLYVPLPVDSRKDHYGEPVASTRWTGCRSDTFWGDAASRIIQDELAREIENSGLFSKVHTATTVSPPLTLESRVRAFCSQAVGFLFIRVAGITSLEFTLREGERTLLAERVDRVVTDADAEYTGSSAGFIKQAMRVTMSDSLRELLREFLPKLESAVRESAAQGAAAAEPSALHYEGEIRDRSGSPPPATWCRAAVCGSPHRAGDSGTRGASPRRRSPRQCGGRSSLSSRVRARLAPPPAGSGCVSACILARSLLLLRCLADAASRRDLGRRCHDASAGCRCCSGYAVSGSHRSRTRHRRHRHHRPLWAAFLWATRRERRGRRLASA